MTAIRLVASCAFLIGLVGCGRASRGAGEATSVPDAPEAQVASSATSEQAALETELERTQQRHTGALAEGDAAERARATFELAEAHASAAYGLYAVVYELYELRLGNPTRRSELDLRVAELEAQQRAWLDAAALEYAEVIRTDEPAAVALRSRARHGLAEVERSRGNPVAMHDLLVALLHDDPTHPLASSARMTLADEAFQAQRFAEAQSLYEQVIALHGDEQHYAHYKLGWIALNVDDGQAALGHFTAVVREAGADPRQHALVEAATKDCVLAYARVGRPERARAFFMHLDPGRTDALLQRLAEIYRQEGRLDDAARAVGASP